jgi:amino acid adenylation domain-containing protein
MQTDLPRETDLSQATMESYRLSPQQRLVWRLQEHRQLPNAQVILRIAGHVDEGVLHAALEGVRKRHEALRTTFHRVPGMTLPLQTVNGERDPEWRRHDLQHLTPQDQDSQATHLAEAERHTPFDLEHGPIVRPLLVDMDVDRHLLVITLPAVSMDRRALSHLAREVALLFSNLASDMLDEDPLQYVQYAEWQEDLLESEDPHARAGRAFWSKQTEDASPLPPLPFGHKPGDKSAFAPAVLKLDLESSLLQDIDRLAEQSEVSAAVLFETLWAVLLFRFTGTSALTLSHGCDGRSYPELENAVGILAKALPVRLRVEPSNPLWLLLREANSAIREATGWEEYYSPESRRSDDLLPYRFEYEDWSEMALPGHFSLCEVSSFTEAFDLGLGCRRNSMSMTLEFQFDPQRYSRAAVRRIADHYQMLLRSAIADPQAPIGALAVVPEAERQQLLQEWSGTEQAFPHAEAIHHLFEKAAQAHPHHTALVFEDQILTYQELNRRANQLAHYLQKLGVGPEVTVGLCLERSLEMIVGILGILKAGGAYLPLDPALPRERLDWMLQDSGAKLLVTQQSLADLATIPETTLILDRDAPLLAQQSQENPKSGVGRAHLVYLIYTSGSTGRPKGVGIEHAQLLNYVQGIALRLGLGVGASYATVSTIAADLGNTAIFPALCSGGCLHVVSGECAMDPHRFREYNRAHPIDCLKIVPSHLWALLGSGEDGVGMLPHQVLVLGGESSSWELVERIRGMAPGLRVLNHYGPTETTVGVLTYALEAGVGAQEVGSVTVPLGRGLPNSRVYVLNECMQPVPVGVRGELYIGGAGVGRGYRNQSELTEQKFVADPFGGEAGARLYRTGDLGRWLVDGNIEFVGRMDHQVKIRGYRIELGEIESVLLGHGEVGEAVVLAREDIAGNKRLVGYVVGNNGSLRASKLREHLREKLPEYMVPSSIVLLSRLPLTGNGKLDREGLPAPEDVEEQAGYVGARNAVEAVLAGIWEELLHRDEIGVDQNFFELGGHSLLATQVISRVRETFQVEVPLRALFDAPTIASFAELMLLDPEARIRIESMAEMLVSLSGLSEEELERRLSNLETNGADVWK